METPTTRGLSSMQAAERFKQFGPNEIARPHGRNLRRIALDTLREPMFLLPELAKRGHAWRGGFEPDGKTYKILIRVGAAKEAA